MLKQLEAIDVHLGSVWHFVQVLLLLHEAEQGVMSLLHNFCASLVNCHLSKLDAGLPRSHRTDRLEFVALDKPLLSLLTVPFTFLHHEHP